VGHRWGLGRDTKHAGEGGGGAMVPLRRDNNAAGKNATLNDVSPRKGKGGGPRGGEEDKEFCGGAVACMGVGEPLNA
jgi:hypothetical protein